MSVPAYLVRPKKITLDRLEFAGGDVTRQMSISQEIESDPLEIVKAESEDEAEFAMENATSSTVTAGLRVRLTLMAQDDPENAPAGLEAHVRGTFGLVEFGAGDDGGEPINDSLGNAVYTTMYDFIGNYFHRILSDAGLGDFWPVSVPFVGDRAPHE